MATPTLTSVTSGAGPASGGDLLRLVGTGFAPRVALRFGGRATTIVAVRNEAGFSLVDVRAPAHEAGVVDVELRNLDASEVPIAGEPVLLARTYRALLAVAPATKVDPFGAAEWISSKAPLKPATSPAPKAAA